MDKKINFKIVFSLIGAYVAALIGPGYATGQEIMQFFTGHGLLGIIGIIISGLILASIGSLVMSMGFNLKNKQVESIYGIYCGKTLGKFFDWFVPIVLFLIVIMMISGAGATINQYYKIPHLIGSTLAALIILIVYLFGIQKIVKFLGVTGIIVLTFTLLIGTITLFNQYDNIQASQNIVNQLPIPLASQNWFISGFLYASYMIFGSLPFLLALGSNASNKTEAAYSGFFGGIIFAFVTIIMNLALFSNIEKIYNFDIPTIELTKSISPLFTSIFVIILLIGIISTTEPKLWTVCEKINSVLAKRFEITTVKKAIITSLVMILALIGGQLPFTKLINIVYPFTGYIGFIVIIAIITKKIKELLKQTK